MSQEAGSRLCVLASRIFLLLIVILVSIMPLTEYLWHFDTYLSGSEDFELGLLALLAIFCLVLVLLQQVRNGLLISRLRRWPAFILQRPTLAIREAFSSTRAPNPSLACRILPLQI